MYKGKKEGRKDNKSKNGNIFCALLSNDLVAAPYGSVEIRKGKEGGKANHWGTEVANSAIFSQQDLFST